jgi:alkylhydroperoxidase/carboxymuconolactone decarboxylase family protein YurZ
MSASNGLHPILAKFISSTHLISEQDRLLTLLAAHAAHGDLKSLELDWQHLISENRLAGIEAVLQTHLFAGYPRTINALNRLKELDPQYELYLLKDARHPTQWVTDGEKLCAEIYGVQYPAVRTKMHNLHSDLDCWMVEMGYGRVLARPGLEPRLRELCVLSVLAGQYVKPQLLSHIKGAQNVGASIASCRSVLEQTTYVWGPEAQVFVDEILRQI